MLSCPACNYFFTDDELSGGFSRCPACKATVEAVAFPALYRSDERVRRLCAQEDDARCSYHAGNQAETVCSRCGRLICSVCALPLGKQTVCPQCLNRTLLPDKVSPTSSRVAWDSLALMLVINPLLILIWYLTFFTAAASLVISIIFFNKPAGPVPRGKWRFVLAIGFSIAWIGLWALALIYFADKLWPAMHDATRNG